MYPLKFLISGDVARVSRTQIMTTATATSYETWVTTFSDSTTMQSTDTNVYTLVQQNGSWVVQDDQHGTRYPGPLYHEGQRVVAGTQGDPLPRRVQYPDLGGVPQRQVGVVDVQLPVAYRDP